MERCENCDCEFEWDLDNALHYKLEGEKLCVSCMQQWEARRENQEEYLRETER